MQPWLRTSNNNPKTRQAKSKRGFVYLLSVLYRLNLSFHNSNLEIVQFRTKTMSLCCHLPTSLNVDILKWTILTNDSVAYGNGKKSKKLNKEPII